MILQQGTQTAPLRGGPMYHDGFALTHTDVPVEVKPGFDELALQGLQSIPVSSGVDVVGTVKVTWSLSELGHKWGTYVFDLGVVLPRGMALGTYFEFDLSLGLAWLPTGENDNDIHKDDLQWTDASGYVLDVDVSQVMELMAGKFVSVTPAAPYLNAVFRAAGKYLNPGRIRVGLRFNARWDEVDWGHDWRLGLNVLSTMRTVMHHVQFVLPSAGSEAIEP